MASSILLLVGVLGLASVIVCTVGALGLVGSSGPVLSGVFLSGGTLVKIASPVALAASVF